MLGDSGETVTRTVNRILARAAVRQGAAQVRDVDLSAKLGGEIGNRFGP